MMIMMVTCGIILILLMITAATLISRFNLMEVRMHNLMQQRFCRIRRHKNDQYKDKSFHIKDKQILTSFGSPHDSCELRHTKVLKKVKGKDILHPIVCPVNPGIHSFRDLPEKDAEYIKLLSWQ